MPSSRARMRRQHIPIRWYMLEIETDTSNRRSLYKINYYCYSSLLFLNHVVYSSMCIIIYIIYILQHTRCIYMYTSLHSSSCIIIISVLCDSNSSFYKTV